MDERIFCLRLTTDEAYAIEQCLTSQLRSGHTEFRSLITRLSTIDDDEDFPIIAVKEGQMARIIEDRLPFGRFILEDASFDRTRYVGCDNTDGYAWTAEFNTYGECASWLMGFIDMDGDPVAEISLEEI